MEKVDKLVEELEELEEQIKSITEGVVNNDKETLLEVSEELNTVISKIIEELKKG